MNAETVTVAQARSEFSSILAQTELLHRRFIIERRFDPPLSQQIIEDPSSNTHSI